MRHQDYVVTASRGKHSRTLFWDGHKPLALDHPATWELRRTGDEIQAVYIEDDKTLTFSSEDLLEGRTHELPLSDGVSVALRRVRPIQPAYHPAYYPRHITRPPQFFVFSGQRYLTTAYDVVEDSYRAMVEGKPVWGFVRNEYGYQITAYRNGVRIKLPANHRRAMNAGVTDLVRDADFVRATIAWDGYWWRLNRIPTPEPLPTESLQDPAQLDFRWFKRVMISVASIAVIGVVATLLLTRDYKYQKVEIPAPKTIVLKAPKKILHKPRIEKVAQIKTPAPIKAAPKVPRKMPGPPLARPKAKPKPVQVAKAPAPLPRQVPPPKPLPKPLAKPVIPPPVPRPVARKPVPVPAPRPVARPAPAPAPKIAAKLPPKAPVKTAAVPARTSIAPSAPAKAPVAASPIVQRPAAAQEAAKKQAQLARALNFLSPSVNKKAAGGVFVDDKSQKFNAGGPAAAAVPGATGKGPSILNTIASNSVVRDGVISTTGARGVVSDKVTAAGLGTGGKGARGKGLNDVQGKVSLQALYDPNAGASLGSSLSGGGGGGGLSMSGAGKISESAVQQALSKHLQRFQYCYEKALLNDPTLGGTITMQWTIGATGAASGVKVARSQMKHAGLHSCMAAELMKIRFPKPSGGTVQVKFPFSFTASAL